MDERDPIGKTTQTLILRRRILRYAIRYSSPFVLTRPFGLQYIVSHSPRGERYNAKQKRLAFVAYSYLHAEVQAHASYLVCTATPFIDFSTAFAPSPHFFFVASPPGRD